MTRLRCGPLQTARPPREINGLTVPPRYLREAPVPALSFAIPARRRTSGASDSQSHIVLFNDERYQSWNLSPGQRLFRYDHYAGRRLVGTLSGVDDDGILDCGHSAPFGGIDWVRRREPVGSVVDLLRGAAAHARITGIRELRLRGRPAYFGANETASEFALLSLGAAVEACEISLGIEVWRYPSPEAYIAALGCSARNTLQHGRRAGMAFEPAETLADWAACYELLAETKRRRGVQLKFSLDYLLGLREAFGTRIAMHRLRRNGELAGAALVYRVSRDWDCVVAWGDNLSDRADKVMNAMVYELVRRAIAQGVAIIDLGIASVDGVPDDGLIQFKRSVGGITGLRSNFRLSVGR